MKGFYKSKIPKIMVEKKWAKKRLKGKNGLNGNANDQFCNLPT